MPLHRIDQICDKVQVMYDLSRVLYKEKYMSYPDKYDRAKVDQIVADIQAHARDIGLDVEKHPKLVDYDEHGEK